MPFVPGWALANRSECLGPPGRSHRSVAVARTILSGSIAIGVLGGIVWLMATADGPWDRMSNVAASGPSRLNDAIPIGMDRKDLPPADWMARSVSVGTRVDERREGLTINHRVLEMRSVERPARVIAAGSALVYTDAPELQEKVNDVLDGRVFVKPGSDSLFAIGRLVAARIVRIGADGRVRSVEDVRVSFVGFNIEAERGQH